MNIARILRAFPGVKHDEATNSLIVPRETALVLANFLKVDPEFRFDYCSNVTGVDHLDRTETVKNPNGTESQRTTHGYLETVYHLYSVELNHGPLAIRVRTQDRTHTRVPSLTPVWRSAELQEREAYDLYGIEYVGHPDLRRILMWDEFEDFPMRKDYVAPDDYEYEPTPHDEVLEAARKHYDAPS